MDDTDTSQIKDWRSIITLIVFVLTNLVVLFPFHIPVYVPRLLRNGALDTLSGLRVIAPRSERQDDSGDTDSFFLRMNFPVNFITAPLIADLFLLAILAIGRTEVYDGTVGADNIMPLDIMAFFLTLAYIAISIDASGLIRYLAFKVIQKGGEVGHRLFFYLYIFFFGLGSFIGNDPIILSGTAFLAYMTRVSSNIVHPRAWIHTQFAIANIASAILVSSNPANLVLAGAFSIKFIDYTANMIVPVVVTAIVLFPFLLYIIFANETLIPLSIKMHELPEDVRSKKPVNPNIPNARGNDAEEENRNASVDETNLLSLEEIMNPFLDKGGAAFGAFVMAATLVTVLVINAVAQAGQERPVYWVTLPAATLSFCWDLAFGWLHRHETRDIARKGRQAIELARVERMILEEQAESREKMETVQDPSSGEGQVPDPAVASTINANSEDDVLSASEKANQIQPSPASTEMIGENTVTDSQHEADYEERRDRILREIDHRQRRGRTTLSSIMAERYRWAQETFPTVMAVLEHLPFALVPFALAMFVLVQALVTKGWVGVFAYGWDHWSTKTGTVGSIGGMGFISVILCNFAGTNIGTTILLCRVVQAWKDIHRQTGIPISDRDFWATVYGMAIGVNYGAFSAAFSASLAGLLWRDILSRKHIHVRRLEFARVNLPIIAVAMAVGCTILVGEVYIMRGTEPIDLS